MFFSFEMFFHPLKIFSFISQIMDTLVLDGDIEESFGSSASSKSHSHVSFRCFGALSTLANKLTAEMNSSRLYLINDQKTFLSTLCGDEVNMVLMSVVTVQDTLCYRASKSRIPETSALTSVPCGICPVSHAIYHLIINMLVPCASH